MDQQGATGGRHTQRGARSCLCRNSSSRKSGRSSGLSRQSPRSKPDNDNSEVPSACNVSPALSDDVFLDPHSNGSKSRDKPESHEQRVRRGRSPAARNHSECPSGIGHLSRASRGLQQQASAAGTAAKAGKEGVCGSAKVARGPAIHATRDSSAERQAGTALSGFNEMSQNLEDFDQRQQQQQRRRQQTKALSLDEERSISSCAVKKRSAWLSRQQLARNSSVNSEEGNLSSTESGCVLRIPQGSQEGDRHGSLDRDNQSRHFLKVPSRSPLYSRSPSTDEGIVTDEHNPEIRGACKMTDSMPKSEVVKSSAEVRPFTPVDLRPGCGIYPGRPERRLPTHNDSNENQAPAAQPRACLQGSYQTGVTQHPKNDRAIYFDANNNDDHYAVISDVSEMLRPRARLSSPAFNVAKAKGSGGNQDNCAGCREQDQFQQNDGLSKRTVYKKRGPSFSDTTTGRYNRHSMGGQQMSKTRSHQQYTNNNYVQEVTPQSSPHLPPHPLHRQLHRPWAPISPITHRDPNPQDDEKDDDRPVIVYSRSPNQNRPLDRGLPALYEQVERPRLVKQSTLPKVTRSPPRGNFSPGFRRPFPTHSVDEYELELRPTFATQTYTPSEIRNGSEEKETQFKPSFVHGGKQQGEVFPLGDPSSSSPAIQRTLRPPSSVTSSPLLVPNNQTTNVATKAMSRSGSVKSALADAVANVVGATSSRSILPANNKNSSDQQQTTKEKQKALSERLMTVGPSDPRRVQGIFEDILCEMGEARIIQYKDAFAKFDKDSSGIISSKQLRRLLRTLGHNPSDIELRELVNQVDMDENGKIDFNEFIIMIGYFDKANNEDEDLCNIFRVFDRDEKGSIDVNDLRNIWNDFLTEMAPLDEFEEMIKFIDDDGNGEINRVELLEMLSTR